MPSRSWLTWSTVRAAALDEIEAAHHSVGGSGPGRHYATQQLNRAYAVLLASILWLPVLVAWHVVASLLGHLRCRIARDHRFDPGWAYCTRCGIAPHPDMLSSPQDGAPGERSPTSLDLS